MILDPDFFPAPPESGGVFLSEPNTVSITEERVLSLRIKNGLRCANATLLFSPANFVLFVQTLSALSVNSNENTLPTLAS